MLGIPLVKTELLPISLMTCKKKDLHSFVPVFDVCQKYSLYILLLLCPANFDSELWFRLYEPKPAAEALRKTNIVLN
jgi:hypothetical protein